MTKTVKGRVQATSDKDDKDFFGICIDDEWYNGDGSLSQDVKGYKLELEIDPEAEFKDIRKINVLEEDNEDGVNNSRGQSDAGNRGRGTSDSGGKSSSQPHPKRANIQATAATKKAADIVAEEYNLQELEEGEFEELTSTMATGLNNVMNKLYEENMQ